MNQLPEETLDQLGVPFCDELDLEGPRARRRAIEFLRAETVNSGIIEMVGEGQIRFWHLTFQEHYCARALAEPGGDDWWTVIKNRLCDRQWTEVIDHLAGCLAWMGRRGLNSLAHRILEPATADDLAATARAVGVLGRLVRILDVYDYQPPARLHWDEVLERAMAIFTLDGAGQVPVEQRIAAAEALGQGGDPRIKPLSPEMLPIRDMPGVLLAKYPVTVEEYGCFIENEGYEKPEYWGDGWSIRQERDWQEPGGWDEQQEHPNRPVTDVSWFEAAAYCRWLSEVTKQQYQLPSSDQWERAALHPEGGDFPWGHAEPTPELMNYKDSRVGHPSPVGIYPAGAASGGHLDMAGNVDEWTQSEHEEVGSLRVLRGGGWRVSARSCRSAYRFRNSPDYRWNFLGFRLSRSEP
ncbi:formylglycine-generating enzyme family protein [Candidatus Eisenbacteria bacterium]|uniref:Formylglycine-generating enzyme family protein n=1 Tax=Eiseniibacteriota bacterium TaxID=2212470 RepID=A0ABV6YMB4_UNCEI